LRKEAVILPQKEKSVEDEMRWVFFLEKKLTDHLCVECASAGGRGCPERRQEGIYCGKNV